MQWRLANLIQEWGVSDIVDIVQEGDDIRMVAVFEGGNPDIYTKDPRSLWLYLEPMGAKW